MAQVTSGSAREKIDVAEMVKLERSVVIDNRRRRPLYFDGRFLAAADLTREQLYFLTRQADLGRAGGFGVVRGLMVTPGDTAGSLHIAAGHGVTPSGSTVLLPDALHISLADITTSQRLDASFGLLELPHESTTTRAGLFLLALRPVEFSANAIAAYPTTMTGNRTVEEGEIIEATAITLIPYPDGGAGLSTWERRAHVAREVFLGGGVIGYAQGVLPLAMIAIDHQRVDWVDPYMVRREVGSDHGDVLRLGFAPRALREAHLLQYDNHLRAVVAERTVLGSRFAATDYFQALPPAGRMPAAAIDGKDFTQIFFPPTVDVDISIIPEDELPALLEESLLLPPIDLTRSAEELDSTAILVLIPVPRAKLRSLGKRITSTIRSAQPAAKFMVAKKLPFEMLQGLLVPGPFVPFPNPQLAEDVAWRELLGASSMLWYIRRHNLNDRPELAGILQEVGRKQTSLEADADAKELARLTQVAADAKEQAAQAQAKLRDTEGRADSAETRAALVEQKASSAETRAAQAEKAAQAVEARAKAAEAKVQDLDAQVKKLRDQATATESADVADLRAKLLVADKVKLDEIALRQQREADLAAEKAKSGAAERAKSDLTTQLSLTAARATAAEKAKADEAALRLQRENDLAAERVKSAAAEKAKSDLAVQLTTANQARAELTTQVTAANQAKTDLTTQVTAANQAKTELAAQLTAEKARSTAALQKVAVAEKTMTDLSTKLTAGDTATAKTLAAEGLTGLRRPL
jgi:hypothetical protein